MADRPQCEYLEAPDKLFTVDAETGATRQVMNPEPSLCAWAIFASERLADMPPWLRRNAESGHLWQQADCDDCACYVAKLSTS